MHIYNVICPLSCPDQHFSEKATACVPPWNGHDLAGKDPASYSETWMLSIYLDTEKDKLKPPTLSERTTANQAWSVGVALLLLLMNGHVVVTSPVGEWVCHSYSSCCDRTFRQKQLKEGKVYFFFRNLQVKPNPAGKFWCLELEAADHLQSGSQE